MALRNARLACSKPSLRLALILGAALACAACSKSPEEKQREDADLKARVNEKLKSEASALASDRERESRSRADTGKIQDAQIRAESEATFSKYKSQPIGVSAADQTQMIETQVARLRARMPDPSSMQVRASHLNDARTVVCMEVNYKNLGREVGFRRAYVAADVIWVEPEPDDVSHQVFEQNFKSAGC